MGSKISINALFYLVLLFFLFACAFPCFAKDPLFQNNQGEMIKELTRQPVKYRSFMPDAKKRSIVVMDNHSESKTIVVVGNQDVPKLKLKIEFDHNSSALRKSSFPLLRELAMALISSELKNSEFLIAGHTDSDGGDEYNLRLSLNRAKAVKEYLVSNFGISEARLKIRGYGEAMPLKPNTDSFYKQVNRRVEIQAAQ